VSLGKTDGGKLLAAGMGLPLCLIFVFDGNGFITNKKGAKLPQLLS
jgi:hypothetical protein